MPTNINFDKSLGYVRTARVFVQSVKFAPVNVTPPTITGNTTLGSLLTLAFVGQWLNYPSSFAYQWQRDGVNIPSATNTTYTLVQADSAGFITCVVTATNITGSASTASNQIKADFYSAIPINSAAPVISGSTALSSVLTSTTGTWSNTPSSFAYQWKRGATNIGTNASTYTLVAADSAAAITCVVTASNASGSSSPATSNTITVQTYSAPNNTAAPVISGTTTLGSTLTSTTGTFNGNPTPTYGYQWRRNAVNITSETASTYVLVSADSAAAITCAVTATNALGNSSVTSNTITADTYATAFTSTWRTTTASETVTLPYEVAGTYSGTIDWGDGGATSVNSYANRVHTYAVAGDYVITVTGVTTGFRFGNTGDRTKIRSIQNWGTLRLGNSNGYFQGCSNLNLVTVLGTLDLTGTTNLSNMFSGCTSLQLVSSINSWNTASVTFMSGMFNSCSNFNQPLAFNTASVTSMAQMFYSCPVFNSSITFNTAAVTNMTNMFTVCSAFNQPLNFNTANVITFQGMFFGCTAFNSLLTFTTTGVGCSAQEMFYALNSFNTAPIFTSTANITNMNRMFSACSLFNKPLTFDTTSVTNMSYMFAGSSAFNSTLTFTSTANVTNMANMFDGCTAFNQAVPFNTGAVTSMYAMFNTCTAFNQALTFNTTAVTNMGGMFYGCTAFNSALTFTSTANVTDMNNMFRSCVAFNQPLNFNTIKVTTFSSFLRGCTNFNQVINFTTTACTIMEEMFMACPAFNSALTFSSTAAVTTMNQMFRSCSVFNQPLTFNTAAVTNMSQMFDGAYAFNQNIGSWNTGLVTNMFAMFNSAPAFNQNIGSWNVANVAQFIVFMSTKSPSTFSTANLDAIYNGWSAQSLQPNINISFGTAQYSSAGAAGKAVLVAAPKNWTIADGNQEANAFTSTWLVTAGETITLPYEVAGTYSGTIDWGDSSTSVNSYANRTHTYATAGTKTISITGTIIGFRFAFTGSRNNIRTITNWGTLRLGNNGSYFNGCQQLTLTTVAGTLDLTGTTNFANMFDTCTFLTTVNGINSWSTGLVTNFSSMFASCSYFNQALSFPVNTTSSVIMTSMFNSSGAFNSALTFNTSKVTAMNFMFYGASAFNQNIGTWNTGAVTTMQSMFNGATAFQQYLGSWNVANVTNFTNFMLGKISSTFPANYLDNIYIEWEVNGVQPNINITFGLAQYSSAGAGAKFNLQNLDNWTITDGGEGV
jgi:surface protein